MLPAVAAACFVLQFAIMDAVFRGGLCAIVPTLASIAIWTLGLFAAKKHRVARIAIAAGATAIAVVQVHVFRYYHTPLDVQVAASAVHAWHDVRAVLTRGILQIAITTAGVFA